MATHVNLPIIEEIRVLYHQSGEAVVAAFEQLVMLIRKLEARVQALEDQRAKNSRDTHKSPSSDGLKKPKTRSLRQPGYPGHTLKAVEHPDHIQAHRVTRCQKCHTSLEDFPASQYEDDRSLTFRRCAWK